MLGLLMIFSFIGGLLSFISPCTAIILPSYFAHITKYRSKVIAASLFYFLGLLAFYVPIGLGMLRLTALLPSTFPFIPVVAGIFFLVGLFFILDIHVPLILPSITPSKKIAENPYLLSFFIGGTAAIATSPCIGPIIGSIFLLNAFSKTSWESMLIMSAYTLGLFIPNLLFALILQKFPLVSHFLKGKQLSYKAFGHARSIHSSQAIAGVLFILLGLSLFMPLHVHLSESVFAFQYNAQQVVAEWVLKSRHLCCSITP